MLEVAEDTCTTCGSPQVVTKRKPKNYKYGVATFSAGMLGIGLILELLVVDLIWIYAVFLASMLSAGQFVIPKGLRGLARLRLDQHFLMTSASFGAMIIGAPAEGAAVMFLFYISILLEEKAEDKVREEIQALVELEPPSVTIKVNGTEICTSPEDVRKGTILIVRPGNQIGLDGIINRGATSVNQSSITGESLPIPKSVGDQVYAGTINQEGYIEVEVTEESNTTVLSKIIELVDESRRNRAPTEKAISRFSVIYTPIVVFFAIFVAMIAILQGLSITAATYRGLTLLVISCPCAFAVSIPVSMVSAIAGSARNGILVKGAIFVEQMSKTGVVAFDKTGTLTEGVLSVKDVCLHNDYSRDQVLSTAASIETMSEHPIGRALIEATNRENVETSQASDFLSIPGRGVVGQMGEMKYLVGNRRLLLDNRVPLDAEEVHNCGAGTMVYVANKAEHLGTIILSDTLRPGTKQTIQKLEEMGIHTVMLTGDSDNVAREIAEEIGVDDYRAELLPEQKVDLIKELKKKGITLMVGDGINDTPALAAADVGIAMGAVASDAAIEAADVALMEEDLTKIPELILKSRKTMQVVRQNVATSLTVKAVTGILASVGIMTLWMAIGVGDMGLTFLVIANALRLARKK